MKRSKADYAIARIDETSPMHTAHLCYVITYRGRLIGHLDIHGSGYRHWSFTPGQPRPSQTTQRRLAASVRNDR